MTFSITQKLAAEAIGTALLLAIVVGSGVMADRLADGGTAIALMANSGATGAGLYVLITIFAPVSGAHFNPAVTLAFALRKEIAPQLAIFYVIAQIIFGIGGVLLAHAMFDLEIVQLSERDRASDGQFLAEIAATFGLIITILLCLANAPQRIAASVALFITAAYWFTSSTSFANPAVTIARIFTDTFTGIRPDHAIIFIGAQIIGAVLATWCVTMFKSGDAKHEAGYSSAL